MPLGRGGNNDGLEVGYLQQIRVQLEGPGAFTLHFLQVGGALLEVLAIHVAERDQLDAPGLKRGLGVHHAVPAAAD